LTLPICYNISLAERRVAAYGRIVTDVLHSNIAMIMTPVTSSDNVSISMLADGLTRAPIRPPDTTAPETEIWLEGYPMGDVRVIGPPTPADDVR
jgi:hypothetical protein